MRARGMSRAVRLCSAPAVRSHVIRCRGVRDGGWSVRAAIAASIPCWSAAWMTLSEVQGGESDPKAFAGWAVMILSGL